MDKDGNSGGKRTVAALSEKTKVGKLAPTSPNPAIHVHQATHVGSAG
jgi:hypothetical protein